MDVGFRELKAELKEVAEDMGINMKKLRPLSKLTDEQVEEIKLMFKAPEPKPEPIIKKKESVPWKPSKLLDIPESLKDPAFTYRWCDKDKPGNIRKKLSEGWIIDKDLMKKMEQVLTIEDGKPLDTTTGIRELIVMKIPKDKAEARNEFYQARGKLAMKKKQDELDNEVRKIGGEIYGNIKESVGI